jgi:hypothetical protein
MTAYALLGLAVAWFLWRGWAAWTRRGWNMLSPEFQHFLSDNLGPERLNAVEEIGLRHGLFEAEFFSSFRNADPVHPEDSLKMIPWMLGMLLSNFANDLTKKQLLSEAITVTEAATCLPNCMWTTISQLAILLHMAGRTQAAQRVAKQALADYERAKTEQGPYDIVSKDPRHQAMYDMAVRIANSESPWNH